MGNVNDNSSTGEMTFFEHLDALRPHLVRSALAIIVIMIVAFVSHKFIIDKTLMGPQSEGFPLNRLFDYLADKWDMEAIRLKDYTINMINTNVYGQFNIHIKISIITAIVLAVPYSLWEMWRFIRPALTDKEARGSRMFVAYISGCFLAGVMFGYFILVPITLNFFMGYTISPEIINMIDIGSYLSTVMNVSLACGFLFLLPVLMYFLARMGMITVPFLRKYRKHAFVLLLIFSAIITPPDIFSLVLVIIPLYGLYEVGIVITGRVERKKAALQGEDEQEEDEADGDGKEQPEE